MGREVPAGLPFLKSLLSVDPGIATVASMDAEMRKARTFEIPAGLTVTGARSARSCSCWRICTGWTAHPRSGYPTWPRRYQRTTSC